jgi:hypothetical protein
MAFPANQDLTLSLGEAALTREANRLAPAILEQFRSCSGYGQKYIRRRYVTQAAPQGNRRGARAATWPLLDA